MKEMGTVLFAAWLNIYYLISFKLKFSEEPLSGVAEWWIFKAQASLQLNHRISDILIMF